MTTTPRKTRLVVGIMVALAVLIFLLDARMPLGCVPSPLFVAVVGASMWLPGLRPIFISAFACTLLTVLGHFASPPGPIDADLFNRACSILAIWVVVLFCALYKRMEQRSLELAAIVESSGDAIHSKSLDGVITSWNAGAQSLFGYAAEEVLGRPAALLYPPDRLDEESRVRDAIKRGEGFAPFETVRVRRDGSQVPVSLSFSRIVDAGGTVVGVSSIARDITERKRAAEELQKAKEVAEAASRAKSEFLASMSHEIRTPMNGVFGMLDLALDTDLPPEQRHYLERARASADLLLRVINDILDFSKIEAGRLDLEPAPFSLRESLGESIKAFGPRAHRKELELALHIRPDIPDGLVGDAVRLGQVLTNLIGNAIKFTGRGEVILKAGLESAGSGVRSQESGVRSQRSAVLTPDSCLLTPDSVCLHFAVTDTGVGIPADKQQLIFGAFAQADSSMARRFGGTGLGLAISARLVELMGGRIWVESEVGKGSTFHFTARFGLQGETDGCGRSPDRATRAERIDLEALPVLAADDNETNRGILTEMLANWRMKPTAVDSGRAALAELRRAAAAGDPFPLVLLDAVMPDLDGFAVAQEIRNDPSLAGATIMMLSSADRGGELARCRELGIALYLRKPLKQSELLNAVLTALGMAAGLQSASAPPGVPAPDGPQSLRILVVEDNEFNQELALSLLKKRGHSTVLAGNGKAALAAWEREPFDVILMDVQMPEMDGFAVTAAIRAKENATNAHVPIVALTAHAMKGDRERCLAAGMDAYASKPIRAAELFEIIARLLPSEVAGVEGTSGAGAPPGAVFDLDTALATVGGDRELLPQMVQWFLARCPKTLEEIRDSVMRGDSAALERAAHKLKSTVGSFGAQPCYQAALRLEELGRAGEVTAFEQAHGELEEAVRRLKEALTDLVRDHKRGGSLLDPVAVLTACGDDAQGLRRMCQDFQVYAPARLAEMGEALRDRDAPRLRQAAHKFCPLLLAFSTVAGNVASDLEDHAAGGQLEKAQPLVQRLETMTQELMRLAGGLSLETLRQQAEASRDRQPAGQPITQQAGDS
jgi:PAS domain S-box-containing protein